jgi:hypothetical protein
VILGKTDQDRSQFCLILGVLGLDLDRLFERLLGFLVLEKLYVRSAQVEIGRVVLPVSVNALLIGRDGPLKRTFGGSLSLSVAVIAPVCWF